MEGFAEKVVIVTGAGSGIGRATALLFAREKARVVVADIQREGANETVATVTRDGGTAIAVVCDIASEPGVKNLVMASISHFKRIDVLVNNAASFLMKGTPEANAADWQAVMATNVAGTALCSRYAAEQMKASGGGAIIVVGSVSGLKADAGYATYCSSKAALLMLTRCMALDFGPWHIRVNCVLPGPVNTPALQRELQRLNMTQQEFEDHIQQKQCLPQLVQPEDVAQSILFLASDKARMITGAHLIVDGGYAAGQ